MSMIRKKKADFIFLYIKKIFVLMLVLIMGLTSVSQNIHAQTQENLLGIESQVNYSDDLQNGTIYLDLQNVNNDNYEIREILDPQMNQLSMESLEYAVTANGDYKFTVKYIERDQKELKDEKEEDNGIDAALSIDDLQIEEKINTYELVVTVDGIMDSNTGADETMEPDTDVDETMDSNTDVDGTIESDTDYGVSTVNAVSSNYATREAGNVNLEDVFDVDSLNVVTDTGTVRMEDTTNVKGSVSGNKIVLYDAKENEGIPTSFYNQQWWQTATKVDANNRLSLKSDWELVYSFTGPKVRTSEPNGTMAGGNRGSIYLKFGEGSASAAHDIEIGAMADGFKRETKVFIWDDDLKETSAVVGGPWLFAKESQETNPQTIIVTCDYDDNNTAKITISCPNSDRPVKEVSRNYDVSIEGTDSVSVAFGGDATWGKGDSASGGAGEKDYPTGEVSVTFESLSYTNLNPEIVSIKWFKDGTELNSESTVSPGDILSVKVRVKNDSEHKDVLPATLYPSDNFSLAPTHGIDADYDGIFKNGIKIEDFKNEEEEIEFDVQVLDTIGDISLGVRLQDDFFRTNVYLSKQTRISVTDIFAKASPSYTVSNPKRDADGKAEKEENGELVFEADQNQKQLNQDSYVKVAIDLKNPREIEDMDIVMSADTTTAPGLDFTTVHGLQTSNNVASITKDNIIKLLNGMEDLTFKLPANESANISFYVPVKQKTEAGMEGKPFDTGVQEIEYTIKGTITVNGNKENGSWTENSTVMDSVQDIDASLKTNEITLERDVEFDLSTALLFEPVTDGVDVSVDFKNVVTTNQGASADWKLFGLENASDYTGKVVPYAEGGIGLPVDVTYNGILTLIVDDSSYKHYTRLGNEVDEQRTYSGTVTLKVNDETPVTPVAYFEIPKSVYLNDWEGIDDAHAGIKAEVKLIADVETTKTFTVEADNNFAIKNSNATKNFTVSLYDNNDDSGNPVPYTETGTAAPGSVKIGTINDTNRSKTVWYNLVKDPSLAPGEHFTGTMQFFIKME